MAEEAAGRSTDNPSDPGGATLDPDRSARPWLEAIRDARQYFQYWNEKCNKIDKLFADLKKMSDGGTDREFQMFWANLEILKPSIYSRPPVPVVVPRFKDMKPIPRAASEILERSLVVSFEEENNQVNNVMISVRDDMVTSARGAAWVRIDQKPDGYECVKYDHLDRQDFLHEPARKWEEVGWVAKRAWLTRERGIKRFGDIFLRVQMKSRKELTKDEDTPDYQGEKKGEVWEIWSKTKATVVWVADGVEDVLDVKEPFLQLDGFYPCPKPAYSTVERQRLIPVPDFVYYRDQLEEINELTARISSLAEALRMKGFYGGGTGDLAEAIETAMRQQNNNALLVPVANFAALGGVSLKDSIIWLPVVEIANTVKDLVLLRRQLIDDVYQITGLSDIMRGATDPNETLGAQELKSQYGSIRIRERQAELVRFARDLTRLAAEIMAENFKPETLLALSQQQLPTDQDIQGQVQQIVGAVQRAAADPNAQMMAQQNPQQMQQMQQQAQAKIQELQQVVTIDQVVALLREQRTRPFILEIETDSTIQPDENAEKEKRTEFLTALGGVMQQLGPMVQAQPASAPFAVEILKFAVAPFRAGRSLEQAIEQFGESVKGVAENAMNNPPSNPEKEKADAQMAALKQKTDAEMVMSKQKHDQDMEHANLQHQQKMEANQQVSEERQMNLKRDRSMMATMAKTSGAKSTKGIDPESDMAQTQMLAQAIAAIGKLVAQQQQMMMQQQQQMAQLIAQGNQQVIEAITAPKVVTTPDGRTYTSQTATVN